MNTLILSDSFLVKDALSTLLESNFKIDNIEMATTLKDLSTDNLKSTNLLLVDLNNKESNDLLYINTLKESFRQLKVIIFDFLNKQIMDY